MGFSPHRVSQWIILIIQLTWFLCICALKAVRETLKVQEPYVDVIFYEW